MKNENETIILKYPHRHAGVDYEAGATIKVPPEAAQYIRDFEQRKDADKKGAN